MAPTPETRLIPLANSDEMVLVDADIAEELEKHEWSRSSSGYAAYFERPASTGKLRAVFMHRVVIAAEPGLQVDHINQDRLDNRRINLRQVTQSLNDHNSTIKPNSTSGYRGAAWEARRGYWRARYFKDGQCVRVGRFATAREAAEAALAARKEAGLLPTEVPARIRPQAGCPQ